MTPIDSVVNRPLKVKLLTRDLNGQRLPLHISLNTRYPDARADTVLAETSDPGHTSSTLYEGRDIVIFSGRTQYWWSIEPLPTCNA